MSSIKKVIILGADRGICRLDSTESYPCALESNILGKTVLDWQLSALKECGIKEVIFVGVYHIEKIIARYPGLKFYFNPDWNSSNQLYSLFCAQQELTHSCLISYSDIVYRPEVIHKIIAVSKSGNIVVGVETQ